MSDFVPQVLDWARAFLPGRHVVGATTTETMPRVEKRDVDGDRNTEQYPDHQLEEFTWDANRISAMYNFFVRMDPAFPFQDDPNVEDVEDACNAIAMMGAVPTITWEPDPRGPAYRRESSEVNPENILARINTGSLDTYMQNFFTQARNWRGTILLRPLHEMNISTYPWGGVPEEYRAAFQHIARIRNDVGAQNVKLVWSPNANPAGNIPEYWPGANDAQGRPVVDSIALDGYIRKETDWHTPGELFEPALAQVRRLTSGAGRQIPIGISEFGYEDGVIKPDSRKGFFENAWEYVRGIFNPHARSIDYDKAEWIEDAYEWFADNDVRFSFYFHLNKYERVPGKTTVRAHYFALNSDAAQIAFHDATEDDEFVKSFDPSRGVSPDRRQMLDRLFKGHFSMPPEDANVNPRVLARYRDNIVQLRGLVTWLQGDGRQIWENPFHILYGESERIRDSQRLLAMGELLTTMGKFDMARMVFALVPRKPDGFLTQLRRYAVLGMANATQYRADTGDIGQAMGRFHWLMREVEAQRQINRNPYVGDFLRSQQINSEADLPRALRELMEQDRQVKTVRQLRLETLITASEERLATKIRQLDTILGEEERTRTLTEAHTLHERHMEQVLAGQETEEAQYLAPLRNRLATLLEDRPAEVMNATLDGILAVIREGDTIREKREELGRISTIPLASIPSLPRPAGWWEIDDIGFMAGTYLGFATALIGRPDATFEEKRAASLPYLNEAERLFTMMDYRPWHVLQLAPQIGLARASIWEAYANLLAAADKAQFYAQRVTAARQPFEHRRWDERYGRAIRGNAFRMEFPPYYEAEAALIEADIHSKRPGEDSAEEAVRIIRDRALPLTLIRSQRARAYLILARAHFNLQGETNFARAREYCQQVRDLQRGRAEPDGLLLGADLILADMDSITGSPKDLDKSIGTYTRILRLYREVRVPTFFSVQAEYKLVLALAQGGGGGLAQASSQLTHLFTNVLMFIAGQESDTTLRQNMENEIRDAATQPTGALRALYQIANRPDIKEQLKEGWGLDLDNPVNTAQLNSVVERSN